MAQASVANLEADQSFAYDVFLSYNSAQKDWTRELARRLTDDNFRVFFDEWEMPKFIGRTWMNVLADNIERTPKIVLVCSPEFFTSEWTRFETNVLQLLDPVGEDRKILPLIAGKCELPLRIRTQQALPFSMPDDENRPAAQGTVEFEFRYQQLLFNLDRRHPIEVDFERFKRQWQLRENQSKVIDADSKPLTPADHTSQMYALRSVIYQTPRYSTPTYFLDSHLAVISWNVSFELIFKPILSAIRRHHVNYFIVELANQDEVFDHAREFTDKVKEGHLPLIDLEPLVYESPDYGRVEFVKIATQLTDRNGELKSWAVSLLLKKIDWTLYYRDLEERLQEDRLWGAYAISYDAILRNFQPYQDLADNVLSVLPSRPSRVLELGAGTGNVTQQLLQRGHSVVAVENNPVMLENMAAKGVRASSKLTVLMESIDSTDFDDRHNFDAAVAVNVAYALDDPLGCFRKVAGALRPGGIFALSTTHSNTSLDALLAAIKADLEARDKLREFGEHYECLVSVNRMIERTIARRYSIAQYHEWLEDAGFQLLRSQPGYFDAVEVIHARRT
ncbi:MAG TPA: TIR domain-containing protein [Candidatus Bathyarchaeia archaeon]|nr:TIR domain-containing protein [Candidatus Bathyarchaeia archaeon]